LVRAVLGLETSFLSQGGSGSDGALEKVDEASEGVFDGDDGTRDPFFDAVDALADAGLGRYVCEGRSQSKGRRDGSRMNNVHFSLIF
jgi:hypothetical protein